MHLSFDVDWTKCPLDQMLCAAVAGELGARLRSEIHELRRNDLRIVWIESSFTDPLEKRLALSRSALALRAEVLPLFTFSFWPDDKPRWEPVWTGIFETFHLAEGQRFRSRN